MIWEIIMKNRAFVSLFTLLGLLWGSGTVSAMDDMKDENLIPPRKAIGSKVFPEDPELDFFPFVESIFGSGLRLPHSTIGTYQGKIFEIDAKHTSRNLSKMPAAPLHEGYTTYVVSSMNTNKYKLSFSKYIEDERKYLFLLNTSRKNIVNHKIPITFFDENEGRKRKQEVADALQISSWSFPVNVFNKSALKRDSEVPRALTLPTQSTFPDEAFVHNLVQVLQNHNFGWTLFSITLPDNIIYRVSNQEHEAFRFRAPIQICNAGCELTEGLKGIKCKKGDVFTPTDICNFRNTKRLQHRIPSDVTTYHYRYDLFVDVTNCNKLHRELCYDNMSHYESLYFELDLAAMGLTEDRVSVENDTIFIKELPIVQDQ
jgi:hypothetical protein